MFDFKAFRRINKLTQKGAAELFGVSQAFISQIEKGIRPIPSNFITRINEKVEFSDIPTGFEPISVPMLRLSAKQIQTEDEYGDCNHTVSPIADAQMAFRVTDDSMAPEYPNGAKVLVKRIDETKFIEWGRVYVLNTCNGIVIRKVLPTKNDDTVLCCALNERFPNFEIKTKDVDDIYRVILCISFK